MAASCRMQTFIPEKEEYTDGGRDRKTKAMALSLGKKRESTESRNIFLLALSGFW